jgi:hypothetical protein
VGVFPIILGELLKAEIRQNSFGGWFGHVEFSVVF